MVYVCVCVCVCVWWWRRSLWYALTTDTAFFALIFVMQLGINLSINLHIVDLYFHTSYRVLESTPYGLKDLLPLPLLCVRPRTLAPDLVCGIVRFAEPSMCGCAVIP